MELKVLDNSYDLAKQGIRTYYPKNNYFAILIFDNLGIKYYYSSILSFRSQNYSVDELIY